MAATMPKDLKRETWKKIKPVLMKKTGLGEELEAYAKKKEAELKNVSLDAYKEITTALEKLKKAVDASAVIAKAGKYKDCEESLKGYGKLIAEEAKALMVQQSEYQKDLDAWVKVRVDCIAGMNTHQKEMDTLVKKIASTVKTLDSMLSATKTLAKPVIKQAVGLAEKDLTALEDLRKKYLQTCDTVRIAKAGKVALHANDRDPEYLVKLNKIQSNVEGSYHTNKAELERVIKGVKKLDV